MISIVNSINKPCPNNDGCKFNRSKQDRENYCLGNYLICMRFTLCQQQLPVSKNLHPSGLEVQILESENSENIERVYATVESQYRKNLKQGVKVAIVLKKDQRSGKISIGIIDKLLTNKPKHTRGIKVRLKDGRVGRVQKILKN